MNKFHIENGIRKNRRINHTNFQFKVFGLKLNSLNPKFRKEALHINDIQHILNYLTTKN